MPFEKQNGSYLYFNPRSREGSDHLISRYSIRRSHFNPRSREGSDTVSKDFYPDLFISIHAPAKGATDNFITQFPVLGISIHAPAKGATDVPEDVPADVPISIHAPAKGATGKLFVAVKVWYPFQSTLPRRERQFIMNLFKTNAEFQSTLPRRERRGYISR